MKKLTKRVIAAALAAFVLAVSILISPTSSLTASANIYNGANITLNKTSTVPYSLIGVNTGHYTYRYSVTDTDGNSIIAYCIEPAKAGPNTGVYTGSSMGASWVLMRKVMYYGFGGPGFNETGSLKDYYPGYSDDQYYALTHIALGYCYWALANSGASWNDVMFGTGLATEADFNDTHPIYGNLVKWLGNGIGCEEISASANKQSIVCDKRMTIEGTEYAISSETIQVSGKTSLPANVKFFKGDINNPSSMYVYAGSQTPFTAVNETVYVGKVLSAVTSGGTDYVGLSSTGISLMAIATGASQTMSYYIPNTGGATFTIGYNVTTVSANLTLSKTGLKPSSISGTVGNYTFGWTNQGVGGATYGIYAYEAFTTADGVPFAAGVKLKEATTASDGKLVFSDIPVSGNTSNDQLTRYYVREISAATGYQLDPNAYGLSWTEAGGWSGNTINSGVCNVADSPIEYAGITFPTKQNQGGAPLAGATMGIYNNAAITVGGTTIPAGTLIRTAVTGSDGKVTMNISDLPYGQTWIYKEVSAPAGYEINTTDSFTFVTTAATQTPTGPIIDDSLLGTITIEKHGDSLVGISGTEGNYTFNYAETALNDFTFDIYTVNELVDVTGWTFPANTKIATATTGSATGTVYTTTNSVTGLNVEISTSATGAVTISNLIFGEYRIVEVSGQQGYVINGEKNVTTSATEPVKVASFTNDTIDTPVNAQVKIDEAGNPVKNAVFGLYTADTITAGGVTLQPDTLLRTVTTGDDGKIDFVFTDLPFGHSFYTKEITQPTGYVANTEKVTINIDGTEQNPANVINKEQYGIIKVSKSGEVLTGVTGSEGSYSFTYAVAPLDNFTYNVIANEEITAANGFHFTQDQVVAVVTTGNVSACQSKVDTGSLKLTFSTDSQGNIVVAGLPLGQYRIEEASGKPGYVIEGSNIVNVVGDDTGLVSVSTSTDFVNLKQECVVEMTKKDSATAVILEGAEFTIYAAEDITLPDGTVIVESGKAIETITTDASGKAKFTAVLPYGFDYTVKETKAPEGYVLADFVFDFAFITADTTNTNINLTTDDATATNDFVVGEIEIRKNDTELLTNTARGEATLNGAVYEIIADGDIMMPDRSGVGYHDGDVVAVLVTGEPDECVSNVTNPLTFTSTDDGQIKVTGLYLGKYVVKEKTASIGYLVDATEYNVTLTYVDDKTPIISDSIISKEQVARERFFIHKRGTDGSEWETYVNVKDAEFKLYASIGLTKDGEKYKIETDSYAVHKMWKTGAEDDYILVASEAEEAAAALIGFDNSEEYVLISDDKGYLESGYLPYGIYVLHETKTPAGRNTCSDLVIELTEDKEDGFWNDDKEEKDYTLYNNAIIIKKNPIKISKYDVTGTKELPGATLRLTDANGNVIDEWVSTDEPHIVSGLIVGQTYTLTEIIAPKNYKLATSIQFVTVKDPNNTMHVIMRDEFNLKIRTGEVGLNMWIYFAIMMVALGAGAFGFVTLRKRIKNTK